MWITVTDESDGAFAEILEACRPEAAEASLVASEAEQQKSVKRSRSGLRRPSPMAVLERKLTGARGVGP